MKNQALGESLSSSLHPPHLPADQLMSTATDIAAGLGPFKRKVKLRFWFGHYSHCRAVLTEISIQSTQPLYTETFKPFSGSLWYQSLQLPCRMIYYWCRMKLKSFWFKPSEGKRVGGSGPHEGNILVGGLELKRFLQWWTAWTRSRTTSKSSCSSLRTPQDGLQYPKITRFVSALEN